MSKQGSSLKNYLRYEKTVFNVLQGKETIQTRNLILSASIVTFANFFNDTEKENDVNLYKFNFPEDFEMCINLKDVECLNTIIKIIYFKK